MLLLCFTLTPSQVFKGISPDSLALSKNRIGYSDKINVCNTMGCKGAKYGGKMVLVVIVG